MVSETPVRRWTHRLDSVLLHPVAGPIILAALMFVMFQAVFAWSETPVAWLEDGVAWLGAAASSAIFPTGLLRSLIADGIIAGVGAVVTFLPQILILFFFILLLEGTGYMVRAAFLMDRLMHAVGLSGRAFIPLLSSFACAVPGIMATRTIEDPKDRLTTILIAPLMTCSARLPVYTLIIAAFIPERTVGPGIGLQGLVMFVLYIAGIVGALVVALVLRRGRAGRQRRRLHDGAAQISMARRSRTWRSACGSAPKSSSSAPARSSSAPPSCCGRWPAFPRRGRARSRAKSRSPARSRSGIEVVVRARSASTTTSPSRSCPRWPRAKWR